MGVMAQLTLFAYVLRMWLLESWAWQRFASEISPAHRDSELAEASAFDESD